MCGIFGLLQSRPFDPLELRRISGILRHRGPDDEGFLLASGGVCRSYGGADTPEAMLAGTGWLPSMRLPDRLEGNAGGLALGFRRLAIIDLTAGGHQPMGYRDRYWLVFNGEVYNYLELKQELEAMGHNFRGRSDTEVVLAAFHQWGPACLDRFNGMWGLALYDRREETLLLARDRFGVKPLYLHVSPGRLAFASEIKAFTGLEGWRAEGNLERMLDFLVWGLTDHAPDTLFKGVTHLRPGCHLALSVPALLAQLDAAPALPQTRWYQPGPAPAAPAGEAEGRFRELLTDAVRLRLRADVPIGSCLSGGLDSSTIVCLMRTLLSKEDATLQRTFTARSAEPALDESAHAQAVLDRTGVQGNFVTPEPGTLFRDLDHLVWTQDEPFGSTSIFAQWCVFRLAHSRSVRVMLDGQGADEILCGYRGFLGAYLAELLGAGRLVQIGRELARIRAATGFSPFRSLGYLAAYAAPGLAGLLGRLDGRDRADRSWLEARHRGTFDADPVRAAGGRAPSVLGLSLAQLTATSLPMLLRYEDRNSMAYHIEARTPFLDYRVVEACLGLPAELKTGGGLSKRILRASMRGLVPDQVLDRKDKVGFVTAERVWARGAAKDAFRRGLHEALARFPGLLSPAVLRQFDHMAEGGGTFDFRYWRAISLGHWARRFELHGF